MKVRRIVCFLSFFIIIVGFVMSLIIREGFIYDISMALMCSAFISFMVEFPNYISLKKEQMNKLYYTLFNLKRHVVVLYERTEEITDEMIDSKYFDTYINNINNDIDIISGVDNGCFFSKRKRDLFNIILLNIRNYSGELYISVLNYSISIVTQRNKIIATGGGDIGLCLDDVRNELGIIKSISSSFINSFNSQTKLLLNKKMYDRWIAEDNQIDITYFNQKNELIKNIINNK